MRDEYAPKPYIPKKFNKKLAAELMDNLKRSSELMDRTAAAYRSNDAVGRPPQTLPPFRNPSDTLMTPLWRGNS